jgi:hypothetical protein
MAGLVPAIHVLLVSAPKDVDARHKAGHHDNTSDLVYLFFPARLSKNTPCSPNMFQNHQGRLSRSGRP